MRVARASVADGQYGVGGKGLTARGKMKGKKPRGTGGRVEEVEVEGSCRLGAGAGPGGTKKRQTVEARIDPSGH